MGSLKERVIEIIGGVTPAMLDKRITEAHTSSYKAGFSDGQGNDETVSTSEGLTSYGYKALGSRIAREFKKDPKKATETIWELYEPSGVANWLMEVMRDHFVSSEIKPTTEDEKLQGILDDFWNDNDMSDRVLEFALQLPLLGTQCFPVFAREGDGRLRLGYIDPGEIESVATDPENIMKRVAVVVGSGTGTPSRIYRIVQKDDDKFFGVDGEGKEIMLPAKFPGKLVTAANLEGQYEAWEYMMLRKAGLRDYTGSCIYRTWSSLSNQTRGWSALLRAVDPVDQADETLFNMGVAERLKSYFLIDVEVEGVEPDEIPAYAVKRGTRPPKPGGINWHNDKETWKVDGPDLRQNSSIDTHAEQIKTILGIMGLPFPWFGDGSDTNRATAVEQSGPAHRGLKAKQMVIKKMFLRILNTVRDQAIIAGTYKPKGDEPAEIDLIMPEISTKDTATAATTFNQVVAGVSDAEDAGYITHETAALLVAQAAAAFGVEYDVDEELEKAEAEQAEREEERAAQRGAMLAAGLNVAGFGGQQNGGQGVGVEEE